jgi:hypothetical protein
VSRRERHRSLPLACGGSSKGPICVPISDGEGFLAPDRWGPPKQLRCRLMGKPGPGGSKVSAGAARSPLTVALECPPMCPESSFIEFVSNLSSPFVCFTLSRRPDKLTSLFL